MVLVVCHRTPKNTIQINQNTVPIRYIKMTVLDAFRIFNERFPKAGRSYNVLFMKISICKNSVTT